MNSIVRAPERVNTVASSHASKFSSTTTLQDLPPLSATTLAESDIRPPFSDNIDKSALPNKVLRPWLRHARHTFGNVYRRLFTVVFISNMIAFIIILSKSPKPSEIAISNVATASAANISVAIMIRQEYVINLLFKLCWSVPKSAPLRLRRMLAKVYEFGGVHSGTGVCSTIWFILFTALLTRQAATKVMQDPAVLTITYILLTLLLAIIIFAYPTLRSRKHNTFENVHRFAGWAALILFWVELVLYSKMLSGLDVESRTAATLLIQMPAFWLLLITSLHVILPWLTLRKLYMEPERLSNHVIRLRFKGKIPPFTGMRISHSPLTEWHSFACLADSDGGSLIISNAGDWTRKTIDNPRPYYWTRGIPVTGVLNMAQIFRTVVIVTTGSGIGPCLSFLVGAKKTSCRILWSAQSPLKTFGKDIYNMVEDIDPEAMIIDTKTEGRPDMVLLTYRLYVDSGAEAVFVLSNPKVTRKVVYGMESRGIPAYGPVWDS